MRKKFLLSKFLVLLILITGSVGVASAQIAEIGGNSYSTFADALTAANGMTGDVTVEIYGAGEFTDGMELNGSYTSINFIGKNAEAKLTVNQTAQGDYLEAHGKIVSFTGLILAKANPAWSDNSGHMGNYFSIQGGNVTYTNCIFPNGACTSGGTANYSSCTFQNSSEYGLWVYDDALVTVNGGTINSKKGIKVYSEGEESVTSTLTVKNATFTANVTAKPAVAVGYAQSITLIGNTYNNPTVHVELDSGSDADCEGITFVAQDAEGNDIASTLKMTDRSNFNASCGVLCDGKIYTTVAQAAEDAIPGSTVTLLYDSTETVELPAGVILDTNGYTADGVTVTQPVAEIGETKYATLEAAFAAATEGQTITMLVDATPALTSQRAITKAAVIDLGGKTMTLTEDDLYFGTTTFKNGTIVVDPSVKPSTAVFWMFANQTLTFDYVKIVATGVTGTYLIGLDGNNSDLNLLNGSEILVENTTALDLDIICVNASTGNDIKVENSKVNVTNLDGRVFFRGNYTVKDSEVNLDGITKAGFRIEAGQTLSIEGNSVVTITGEPRDGGIHLTDLTATYTKAETATVNATVNEPKVAKVGENTYKTLALAVAAVEDGGTITLIANETFTENNRYNNGGWWDGLGYSGDKSFTIDLANFTISQDGALNDYLMWFKNDGAKANTITLKNGTLDAGTTAYSALATASSNAQKITVNLENIKIINNNNNGSTVKVRGGAELNVKDGTVITGKDSYLGIECIASTANIYDGAEIYMNGTSSYNGCLAGVGGNGTINVYGGEGQSKSGGFIAMTSGGTINVEGGEWTANTDGAYANDNKSVLVAQSDKQYNAGAGNSIVNVTGGTFKGGYNCYGNAAGDAQINIKGGNFNANPTSYVAENYIAVENNGVWNVVKSVAKIGEQEFATLQAALNAAAQTEELTTIQLLAGTHTFGNVKFPATLKNVTIVGADNKATIIKDSKLYSADGNAVTYKGITFDGIVFDNSSILFTGARNGEVVYEDWTIKKCDFRNLQSIDGIAAIHFNLADDETIKNFTFEDNTITNVTSPSNTASGLRLNYVTGNVVIKDNETNNVAFNAVQIINSEVDNFTFEGNILRSNDSSLANLYNVTGENIVITKNQFLANENQKSVSNIAYADVSGNYWGGGAPKNLPGGVVYSSYYTTVESDGTLGGLVELPQGNNFTGYTGVDAIWGETWGNAKESFVIKVLDANGNEMGTTSLNNVDGIIDGDVNVTWNIKFDAASNTDEYWTMAWTTAPTINNMPAKVELWVDGVKVSGGNVVLNGPDEIAKIYAAVTDASGKILGYYTDIQDAIKAAAAVGGARATTAGTVEFLADVTIDKWIMFAEKLTIGDGSLITLNINGVTIDGNGKTLTVKSIESAGNGGYLFYDAQNLTVKDLTINIADGLVGGIGLQQGTISNVTFNGGQYGVLPGANGVTIDDCTFNGTTGYAVYYESEKENIVVSNNTFNTADGAYAITMRSNEQFTNNTIAKGRVNLANSAASTVSGNDFGTERFKVYNAATATISGNTINNLVFNETNVPTESTFTNNTLSTEAQAAIDALPALAGEGTEANPYTISNLAQLKAFRDDVNAGNKYQGKYVALTADIDLNNEEWTPIGNNTKQFQGYFDGNEKTISNLKISGSNRYVGLFGYIKGQGMSASTTPSVKDLTLENVNVSGDYYVGGLSGQAYTCNITNVTVKGEVSGVRYVGGLVGHVYTYFKDCHFIGNASCSFDALGGIAGAGDCRAYDCSVIGDITGSNWVGGIVGNGQEGTSAVGCYVKGDVKTSEGYYRGVGGIAGVAGHGYSSSEFKNNYFDGEVYLEGEKVPAMIIGIVNANDNESIGTTVEGNSWNTEHYDAETPVYVTAEVTNDDTTEEWIAGASEELTKPRNNNLVMLESDIQYVEATDIDDVTIMKFSEVTVDDILPQIEENNQVAYIDSNADGAYNEGETKYTSFEAALDAVNDGETITLLGRTGDEKSTEIEFTKEITFTITGTAPNYALPVVTFQNATVNIEDATILIPELDARQDATINVIDSKVYDAGGNSIAKSYYNGALNISGNSKVYMMQVTTMGYINISDNAELHATWQTNVYGNGLITLNEGATFNTAALHLTGQDYSDRDNTDADRVGKPAEIVVDGANFTVGKVLSSNGADYSYNSSHGINVGTVEGKSAILNIKNGGNVNIYMANGETANIGAGGTVNIAASTLNTFCRAENGTATLANNGTVYVTGAANLAAANVTGAGWFYMNGVTLDADTKLLGAKVGFINGENNIVGSTIDNGFFSVGIGQNAAATTAATFAEANGITLDDVTVNVSENAIIGGNGETYSGWVGSAYSADKTQHTYTLNVENSLAAFGYMHVSKDGAMTINGHSVNKYTHDNANVDFYAGDLIVNGNVTINNADAWVKYTKMSADHADGVLNITGDTNYESSIHNGSTTGTSLVFYKAGKVNVNIDATSTVEIDNATTLVEGAELNIASNNVIAKGDVTGNGTINFTALAAKFTAQEGLTIVDEVNNKDYKVVYKECTYQFVPKDYVAQIGEDNKFETLNEAFDAAKDGDEIVVLKDITYTKDNGSVNGEYIDGLVYTGDKSFTVDFGGHTINDNGDINDYLVYLKNTGVKENEITFKNGKITIKAESTNTAWAAITVGANSATYKTTLNLNDMEVVNGNPNKTSNQVIRTRNGATVNLNNETVVTSNGTSYGVVAETGSTVNINSGAKVFHTNSDITGGNVVYTAVSGNGTINIYDGATIESDKYAIHNMTSGNTVINIYGGTITAPVAVHVATNGGDGQTAVANISGGNFTGSLETYSNAASIVIIGGTFSVDPTEYLAPGYEAVQIENVYEVRIASFEKFYTAEGVETTQDQAAYSLMFNVTDNEKNELSVKIGNKKPAQNSSINLVTPVTATFDGITFNVTSVADNGFNSTRFKTVTISEGVATIGTKALANMSALTDIVFPSTLKSIGDNCFYGYGENHKIKTITCYAEEAPVAASHYTEVPFQMVICKVAALIVPNAVSYEEYATAPGWSRFYEEPNGGLINHILGIGTELEIAGKDDKYTMIATITSMNPMECSIKIGNTKPASNSNAELVIPTSVDLANYFTIPEEQYVLTVTSIPAEAFKGCNNFVGDLVIPATVRTIGYMAFNASHNSNAGALKFAENCELTTIDAWAFNNSFKGDFQLPASITSIGVSAFANNGAGNTLTITAENSGYGRAFAGSKFIKLVVEEGVKSLPGLAFLNTKFTEVVLPSTLETMSGSAFHETKTITTITINAAVPPTVQNANNYNAFEQEVFYNATLFVPDHAAKALYKEANVWKEFVNISTPIITQTTQLNTGWNWFSYYVNTDLETLETALGENGVQITGKLGFKFIEGGNWYGTLTSISPDQMYLINVNGNINLALTGETFEKVEVTLNPKWNWIGYPSNVSISVNDALDDLTPQINDQITGKEGFATYFGNTTGWVGTLQALEPGRGYKYHSNNTDIVTFEYTNSRGKGEVKANVTTDGNHWIPNAGQYPNNMTMTAMVEVEGGDYEVAAFVDGEVRGSARPIYVEALDAHILFLTIHGDETEEMTFRYYDIATGEEYELNDRINYSNDAIVGSLKEPYIFNRGTTGIGEASLSDINIYPNPTTTGTEINLQSTCDTVEVFNALGVKVAEYHNVDSIDAFETAGIYVIRITDNGDVKHCRLIVK